MSLYSAHFCAPILVPSSLLGDDAFTIASGSLQIGVGIEALQLAELSSRISTFGRNPSMFGTE